MALKLYTREVDDFFLRENFRKLNDFTTAQAILNGNFRVYEIEVTGNVTAFQYAHNLSFVPKDVIQTSVVFSGGAGTLIWNYALFDATFLKLTTSGMGASDRCTVRALIGRFL